MMLSVIFPWAAAKPDLIMRAFYLTHKLHVPSLVNEAFKIGLFVLG